MEINNDSAYHSLQSAKYRHEGKLVLALQEADKAIEANRQSPSAWIARGCTLADMEDYKRAIECYTIGIKLIEEAKTTGIAEIDYANWNNRSVAYCGRGISYKKIWRLDDAIRDYTKAIEIDPLHADFWHNRGNAYALAKNHLQAVSDFKRALTIDSSRVKTRSLLAMLLDEMGRVSEAVSEFRRVLADGSGVIDDKERELFNRRIIKLEKSSGESRSSRNISFIAVAVAVGFLLAFTLFSSSNTKSDSSLSSSAGQTKWQITQNTNQVVQANAPTIDANRPTYSLPINPGSGWELFYRGNEYQAYYDRSHFKKSVGNHIKSVETWIYYAYNASVSDRLGNSVAARKALATVTYHNASQTITVYPKRIINLDVNQREISSEKIESDYERFNNKDSPIYKLFEALVRNIGNESSP